MQINGDTSIWRSSVCSGRSTAITSRSEADVLARFLRVSFAPNHIPKEAADWGGPVAQRSSSPVCANKRLIHRSQMRALFQHRIGTQDHCRRGAYCTRSQTNSVVRISPPTEIGGVVRVILLPSSRTSLTRSVSTQFCTDASSTPCMILSPDRE